MTLSVAPRAAAWLAAVTIALAAGCEDNGHQAIGVGHDFGPNDANLVVAFGDSITSGFSGNPGSPSYVPLLADTIGKQVVNNGTPGAPSGYGRGTIGGVLRRHPGYVLIFFGSNDAIMGYDESSTIQNLHGIVEACTNAQVIPVLTTLPPMIGVHGIFNGGVDLLNPMIEDLAKADNVPLADVHAAFVGHEDEYLIDDGLHPNEAGAEAIATTYAHLFQ